MRSETSKPLPSETESVLRDVDPGLVVPVEPEPAIAPAPSSRYFSSGDYADEEDWWAKQLGRESR